MSTTADEVLNFRKQYKRAKRDYHATVERAKQATAEQPKPVRRRKQKAMVPPALPTSPSELEEYVQTRISQAKPAKKERKKRTQGPKSEKELANAARLKAQTTLAKEIRAKDPSMKWTDAIKQAAKQMKDGSH